MGINDVSNALTQGYTVKLQDRHGKRAGIMVELRDVFKAMEKKGLIKDSKGDGISKQEMANAYAKLNEIHQQSGKSTNYTNMAIGTEFQYTQEDMLKLIEAAGFEAVKQAPAEVKEEKVVQDPVVKDEVPTTPVVKEKVEKAEEEETKPQENAKLPQGAKLLMRQVNGQKTSIAIFDDENGNKTRHAVIQDKDGNQTIGEKLVLIDGAGKNKYMTESKVTEQYVKPIFKDGNLPDGVKMEFVTINGEPTPIFKKDGKTLTSKELRTIAQTNETPQKYSDEYLAEIDDVINNRIDGNIDSKKDGKATVQEVLKDLNLQSYLDGLEQGTPEYNKMNDAIKNIPEVLNKYAGSDGTFQNKEYAEFLNGSEWKNVIDTYHSSSNFAKIEMNWIDKSPRNFSDSQVTKGEVISGLLNNLQDIEDYPMVVDKQVIGQQLENLINKYAGDDGTFTVEEFTAMKNDSEYKQILKIFPNLVTFNTKDYDEGINSFVSEVEPIKAEASPDPKTVKPEKDNDGYITNMLDVLASMGFDNVESGEFGITATKGDKTINLGNTEEELQKAKAFLDENQ